MTEAVECNEKTCPFLPSFYNFDYHYPPGEMQHLYDTLWTIPLILPLGWIAKCPKEFH